MPHADRGTDRNHERVDRDLELSLATAPKEAVRPAGRTVEGQQEEAVTGRALPLAKDSGSRSPTTAAITSRKDRA